MSGDMNMFPMDKGICEDCKSDGDGGWKMKDE